MSVQNTRSLFIVNTCFGFYWAECKTICHSKGCWKCFDVMNDVVGNLKEDFNTVLASIDYPSIREYTSFFPHVVYILVFRWNSSELCIQGTSSGVRWDHFTEVWNTLTLMVQNPKVGIRCFSVAVIQQNNYIRYNSPRKNTNGFKLEHKTLNVKP